jgi:asparagine synthase (glutamine-hydrolysing)
MPDWLNGDWFLERGVRPTHLSRPEGRDVLRGELALHLTETKLPRLLRYGDRNSMAFSLEARFPFLTPGLVGFLLSLPEEYVLAPDGTSKAVLRRAMEGLVPDEVLGRRDKIGFQIPLRGWMRSSSERFERILDEADAWGPQPISPERLRADWRAWADGRDGRGEMRLWLRLNVLRWAQLLRVAFDDGP